MDGYRVGLFGSFLVARYGEAVNLPHESQRLLAFLALHEGHLPRPYVAGNLWPDTDDKRALANLRSTLWRIRQADPGLVEVGAYTVALSAHVDADVYDLARRAQRLWAGAVDGHADLDHRPFAQEFLPGWYDEWVSVERERMRQLCLHCLETIAENLRQRAMFGAAIQTLLTSISLDPLRESPRRQLLAIHVAEGNLSEAVRQYAEFADTLGRELGLAPSATMRDLLPDDWVYARPGSGRGTVDAH